MLAFTVPGDPRGKGRPRLTTIGGHARAFTDKKTVSYENLIRLTAMKAMRGRPLLDEPLQVKVRVRLAPAPSLSAKKRHELLEFGWAPKKPDLDNVTKSVLDACNGVVFRDDALVTRSIQEKVYSEVPGLDVVIAKAPVFRGAEA